MKSTTPIEQLGQFIDRIAPTDSDHLLRIAALPAKKTPDAWWTNNENRKKYYWNEQHSRPWSRQWWLDVSGSQTVLLDAKGEVKKSGAAEIFNYLSVYNKNGYGIYIQLNPCLVGDSGQSQALPGRCIFTESDGAVPADNAESEAVTKALAEQAQQLSPDLVVGTFKSAHTYRISDRLYPSVGAWQVDQSRFTQAAREIWGHETDESLTDANQLMRLPGFNHCRWQNGRMQFQLVRILFDSGKQNKAVSSDLPELEAPIATKSEGSSHDFSPFELGSFAHLLDGFKESGRKGFNTCQCPAHKGQSQDSLHINQATSQFTCHSGCDSKTVYAAALKLAIERGYELPTSQGIKSEHWDYDQPSLGLWGQVADEFTGQLNFDGDAPELIYLLPSKMQSKIVAAETISSPQAIALKAYAEFLAKAGHPSYIADAQELIGERWPWSEIPAKTPLWGWKSFIANVLSHADKESKQAVKLTGAVIKQAAKDEKEAAIKELADVWEMVPDGIKWLDTKFFGNAIVDRVISADDERMVLGVFGATGVGKTYGLGAVREHAREQGRQFVYLTVKENLARAAGRELGLEYRLDLEAAETQADYPDLAGCAASLIENSRGIDWERQVNKNAIVVLDEVDLFYAVVGGAASSSNALEIQRVLSKVLSCAQTIIVISAQLKSRHLKLTERISWADRIESIGILKTATPKTITLCDDSSQADAALEGDDKEGLPKPSIKNWMIDQRANDLREGRNVLTLTGSQKPDSKLGTMLLEQFDLQECGAASALRLDSQSTKDPNNAAFKIADEDYCSIIASYQSVVGSPSCQEGFSLKFGDLDGPSHFEKIYVFDPGSKLPEQLIQDAGRDRHSTETLMLVSAGHTMKKFGGTTDPTEVRRQLKAATEQKETKMLASANHSSPLNWDGAFLKFYCEDIAQNNAALADKIYNLTRYFELVGHEVEVLKPSPSYTGDGIYEEFYERIANQYHTDVAQAASIDRFTAEELQKSKDGVTLEQWYQLQQLQFRQAMRWDLNNVLDPDTGLIVTPENPVENGLTMDAAFIRQWSRDRVAKPWQMHFYAQQTEWDWFAHDFKKTRFNTKYETQKGSDIVEDFNPGDVLSLKSRKLSLLKEYGILDFLNRWAIDVASDRIKSAKSAKDLAQALHQEHRFNRFTKTDLAPIVEKITPNFESVCELLGVKSQRNDDGGINHRQVLTIIRNVFAVKTFTITNASLNGDRGVYVLVADDKAQALRKGLIKADKCKEPDEQIDAIERALALAEKTHNRIEMYQVWMKHRDVERKQLMVFLKEKDYKIDLIDEQRPEHWRSLADWFDRIEAKAITKPVNQEPELIAATDTKSAQTPELITATDETTLLFRLNWCQSFDEYARIRRELESIHPDFAGRYWPLISAEAQHRICSFPVQVSA